MSTAPPVRQRTRGPLVTTVLGHQLEVANDREAKWYEESRDTYMSQLKFTEQTDLADLDRVLTFELLIQRYRQWLASGFDYDGMSIADEESTHRTTIRQFSSEVTRIKSSMSLDKSSRDAAKNLDSPAEWIARVLERAKMFGIHRETQVTKALALFNELAAIVGAFDRSDAEEREKLGFETEAEILDWVRKTAIPEFHAIDEAFREQGQRYWVRDM